MNEEQTVEAEPESSVTSPVLILPGHLFFVERIELPAALENSEINDFAELSLEGIAPFPIEQLHWGFIYSESASSILLYAAYKERIKAYGYKDLDSYGWVLPDFAILSGAYFPVATSVVLESEEGHSAISFAASETLPQQITSSPSSADLSKSPTDQPVMRIELESTEVSERGLPTFHFNALHPSRSDDPGNWKELSPSEEDLWRVDVRDGAFKKHERNNRKLAKWVTRSTAYAILLAVLFLLLEGALFLGNAWLEKQGETIAAQAPEVSRIEKTSEDIRNLNEIAQNELRPIAILEALNKTRPAGIYFTSTTTEGQNKITLDGIANTINELNAYTDALRASGNFKLLSDPKTLTRGGKTTFTATLSYIHTPDVANIKEEDEQG